MEEMSSLVNTNMYNINYLYQITYRSEWEEVVQEYRQNKRAHEARITRSGDTALHIAVADCQEKWVEELVKLVSTKELGIQNEPGNTPLHLAASMGNVRMCDCIAKKDPSLVGIPNKDKETPLFLAALHGRKDAFLCLHYICTPKESYTPCYSYCRREDGDTILHCAITGDYFDLAFQIIVLYKDLVNSVNEDGFTPLHLLASKPSAFKSGSHLTRWNIIIYHCIYVDELKVEQEYHFRERVINTINNEREPAEYPENYKTCINFMLVFRNMFGYFGRHKKKSTDTENPTKSKVSLQVHYNTCFDFVNLLSKAMMLVFGLIGFMDILKIRNMKEKHKWAVQIMDELLKRAITYGYEDKGMNPQLVAPISTHEYNETTPYKISDGGDRITLGSLEESPMAIPRNTECKQNDNNQNNGKNGSLSPKLTEKPEMAKKETPILIAAKNGVAEMVKKILELFPVAIQDLNAEKKNIVLLAAENRQPHVYLMLLNRKTMNKSVFCKVDKDGNSALHLAAKFGDYKPWLIPAGSALQMQWEIKWYEFVKYSMPPDFFPVYNKHAKTANDIFTETHTDLVKAGTEWLNKTSESCSVVAALIVTVAFATATTVPGGINQDTGRPIFENHPSFGMFAIFSLAAVCFSFTSLVIFLCVAMSQYEQEDFGKQLPWKSLGLTSLSLSMVAMLASFCIGQSFIIRDKLNYAAFPMYAASCVPIAYFMIRQLPLHYNLIRAKVPFGAARMSPL